MVAIRHALAQTLLPNPEGTIGFDPPSWQGPFQASQAFADDPETIAPRPPEPLTAPFRQNFPGWLQPLPGFASGQGPKASVDSEKPDNPWALIQAWHERIPPENFHLRVIVPIQVETFGSPPLGFHPTPFSGLAGHFPYRHPLGIAPLPMHPRWQSSACEPTPALEYPGSFSWR